MVFSLYFLHVNCFSIFQTFFVTNVGTSSYHLYNLQPRKIVQEIYQIHKSRYACTHIYTYTGL